MKKNRLYYKNKIKKAYEQGSLSKKERSLYEQREKELDSLKLKRNFFLETDEQRNQFDIVRGTRKTYLDIISKIKDLAAPIEYLTFGGTRPTQKFLPTGDALSDYEKFVVFGSETSFWEIGKAWSDYLGPALQYAIKSVPGLGSIWNGPPETLQDQRDISQYFDRLNYFKYMKLAEKASEEGRGREAAAYKNYAHKTLYGTNTNAPILRQYSAMPEDERLRFEGFRRITAPEERSRLMDLLPEDVKPLMQATWDQQEGKSSEQEPQTDEYKMAKAEAYLQQMGMPAPDWAGWNPHIDMNDVKLKYIDSKNYDPMEFNYWPSQEDMIRRKPYLEKIEEGVPFTLNLRTKLLRNGLSETRELIKTQVDAGAAIILNDNRLSDIQRETKLWGNER